MENAAPLDAWRVAAMTMMRREDLQALLAGADAGPWVEAAAACGMVEAQLRLGRMHLEGEGVPQDRAAAFGYFEDAARGGDADALNMLGRCHEGGWGTAQDFARAASCYRLAAQAGHAWAQYNLGHLLLDGNGVARDLEAAVFWYGAAARLGHVRAMNLLARCHEEGWGTARDPNGARAWYRRSAEGGYFRGAYNYATILAAEGDIGAALPWFTRARDTAPPETRRNIVAALSRHPNGDVRALAA